MKLILNYLKPYRSRVTLGVIIKFLGTMMELVLPWNLAYILDHVIPQKDPKKILFWGGVMLAASAFSLWANIVANRMVSRIAKDTTENIRGDLFQKITYLDTTQIEDVGVSSLVSRVTSDTYNIHYYYLRSDFDFSFSGSDANHLCNGDAYLEKGRALIWKIAKAS